MTGYWGAEAEEALCCCTTRPGHAEYCPATSSRVTEVSNLVYRAQRVGYCLGLETAAVIASRDARECPDHPLHSDAHDWCHAALSIEADIRREIAACAEEDM